MRLFTTAIHTAGAMLCVVSVLLVAPLSLACPQPAVMDATAVSRILWKTRDLFQTDLHAVIRCGAGIPKFKLCYLPCRNRVEIARLILEEAQCAYDFEVVGFRQWAEYVKQQTPHGKCPVLRDYDGSGQVLDQEGAITRFLAQRVGLAGSNALEQAKVDALYCQLFSTLRNNGVSHDGEQYSVRALKAYAGVQHGAGEEGASASRAVPRYRESFRRTYMSDSVTLAERSLSALGVFEERLETNDTGYLCGDAPTYVDLALFHILWELAEEDNVPDFDARFGLPRLGAFLRAFERRPHLRDYLHSPRRMPRYGRDEATGAGLYVYIPGRGSPEC